MPKTHNNLFPQIIDFDNLLSAYYEARRGKKQTPAMRDFHFCLELNIWDLHEDL